MNIKDEAERLGNDLVRWRRDLHMRPELDMVLPETQKYVKSVLDEIGVEYREYPGHSGLTAVIGRPGGPVLGVRADMDALPVKEETGLDYAASGSCMHACGHDGHTAILLGMAKLFKEHEDELKGQIKLIFQPGEENLFGARQMVQDGALKCPDVDRVIGLHVGSFAGNYPKGSVVINRSNAFLASEIVEIEVTGRGGHAASPQLTIDPVVTACEIVTALQTLISRELKPGTLALISITSMKTERITYNVIPDSITIYGGIRARDMETQLYLFKRVEELAGTIAEAHGAKAEFRRISGSPAVINNEKMALEMAEAAGKVVPGEDIYIIDDINMGADDVAYFMQEVPGCYFFISNPAEAEDGVCYPHHNARFRIDDSYLKTGLAVMAQYASDYLS